MATKGGAPPPATREKVKGNEQGRIWIPARDGNTRSRNGEKRGSCTLVKLPACSLRSASCAQFCSLGAWRAPQLFQRIAVSSTGAQGDKPKCCCLCWTWWRRRGSNPLELSVQNMGYPPTKGAHPGRSSHQLSPSGTESRHYFTLISIL